MFSGIDLPPVFPLADAARLIESCAHAEGLRVAQRGTLAQFPGCIHWHFKRAGEPGTLEITLLNRERRVLFAVWEKRAGPWTTEAMTRLEAALSAAL